MTEKDKCHYCEKHVDEINCGKNFGNTSYACTRKEGHEGRHVACGITIHKIKIWKGVKDGQFNMETI